MVDGQWLGLISEEILEEDGKIYEILVAEKGDPKAGYSNWKPGGRASHGSDPDKYRMQSTVQKKWTQEMTQWKNILNNMEKAEKTRHSKSAETISFLKSNWLRRF